MDESGQAHHWGTSAFQVFVQDQRVAQIMYEHLNAPEPDSPPVEPPEIPTDAQSLAHLQALLHARAQEHGARCGLRAMDWGNPAHRPSVWPEEV